MFLLFRARDTNNIQNIEIFVDSKSKMIYSTYNDVVQSHTMLFDVKRKKFRHPSLTSNPILYS